jgi:hypothetical protein
VERAADVYELVIEPASRWRRIWAPIAVLAANLPLGGDGPSNPGGRTAHVVDRRTGQTVASVTENFGDDLGPVPAITEDLASKDAAEFAAIWIDSD